MNSIKFIGLFAGVLIGDFYIFVIFYALASFLAYLFVLCMKFSALGTPLSLILLDHLKATLTAIICCAPLLFWALYPALFLLTICLVSLAMSLANGGLQYRAFSRNTSGLIERMP
jgi:hypothetical protein